uniref:Ribonuclease P protein subunit p20 n=1 Tax=Acrobeloides nanus TaxID=290746 RepID=A0A914DBK7_9BILA
MTSESSGIIDEFDYEIHKRLPPKFHTSKRDVYISKHTKFAAQFKKCKTLLDQKSDDIVIHALGNAIPRALKLALELERVMKHSIKYDVVTSTVHVTDDLWNFVGDGDVQSRNRLLSAVHICLSRIVPEI